MTTDATPLPAIKVSWIFGILGAFLIFVVIATYSSRMAKDGGDYDQQRATVRLATLQKMRETDQQTLTTADWVDQSKGTVRIPIDEAIPEEIAVLKAKPVQMGAEIPGAAPAKPSTVPAAAENQAPAGSPTAPSTNAAPAQPPAPSPAAPTK